MLFEFCCKNEENRCISVTNDNYQDAVKLLTDKFGKREVIIDALYSKLQFLPAATSRNSDVKATFESIEKILRQLQAAKENVDNQKINYHSTSIIKIPNAGHCQI